jgi:hypothetical protein
MASIGIPVEAYPLSANAPDFSQQLDHWAGFWKGLKKSLQFYSQNGGVQEVGPDGKLSAIRREFGGNLPVSSQMIYDFQNAGNLADYVKELNDRCTDFQRQLAMRIKSGHPVPHH